MELLERSWNALQRPETWVAIFAGAGVFGTPLGILVGAIHRRWRGEDPGCAYKRGAADKRREILRCARDWAAPDPPDWHTGEPVPPRTLASWVEHAERRH